MDLFSENLNRLRQHVGTFKEVGLKKLIFGSVTEKVMCENGSAMLIVRPAGDTPS